MKSHIQLKYNDATGQEVTIPFVLAKLRDGYESIESYEVTKENINTYLQYGCTLLKGNVLRYIYDDFSGGDQQETFALQDVSYKTRNAKIKPQTSANSSSLLYLNGVDSESYGDNNGYIIETIIVNGNYKWTLLRNRTGYTILYKNSTQENNCTNVLTIYKKNNTIHVLKVVDDFVYDNEELLPWTHNPVRAIYSEPYLYTVDAFGTIRLFSVSMLSGYLPVRLDLIENNVAHIDKVYSSTKVNASHDLNTSCPARINEDLIVLESEGANLLQCKPYDNNNVTKTDTLIIEVAYKEDPGEGDVVKGFYEGGTNEVEMTKISADAFGYSSMLNSGQCENRFCKRKEAKSTIINDDDLIIGVGTYEEGEEPEVDSDGWIDNISEVEVPLKPIFKIYWASDPTKYFYYQFFVGEEIDIGIRTKSDILPQHLIGFINEKLITIKVKNLLPSGIGFSVGDKWYAPMYKEGDFADGHIQLPENVVPGSVQVNNNVDAINNNSNYYYSSTTQTHLLPVVRQLTRLNIIDKHDLSFSLPNTRLVINRPEYGGRIKSGTTLNYSYVTYGDPVEMEFIPGEFANKHIAFGESVFDHSLFPEDDSVILSNSENHINLRVQLKNQNQANTLPGPNATIIQNEDDIMFKDVIAGEITSMTNIDGQILICSYDGVDSFLYLVNRAGLRLIETVYNEYAYAGILYQGTVLYASFTHEDTFKVYTLGGEVIYEEDTDSMIDVINKSNVAFQKIEDKIYITHSESIICIQPQTTNNYYYDYSKNFHVAGIDENIVVLENLLPMNPSYRKGMLRTSFFTFGKDGSEEKEIVDVNVKCINEVSKEITLYKNHSDTPMAEDDNKFNSLSVQVEAIADAIESITVDFKPEFEKSTLHVFTVPVNPNVRGLDSKKFDPEVTHQLAIDNLLIMPTSTEYLYTDINGVERTVTLEKIQTKGMPAIRNETEQRNRNAYLATFYLRELL